MSVYKNIITKFNCNAIDYTSYSPIVLAYIGDSVYENILRSIAISNGNKKVVKLHESVSKLSMASTQANIIDKIMPILYEDEEKIYKRGRNANKHSSAKNQTIANYKKSTGFEALIGYLYINGKDTRILEIIKFGLKELI